MIYCLPKGKREATDEWFMLTRKYHLALAQVDLTGTRMTYKWSIENRNWLYFQ